MKLTLNHNNLKKAVMLAERIIGRNVSLPVLSNFLFKTDNGRLRISATNLEMGITCWVGAKIEEVGELTVPARVLADLINSISEDKISLASKENTLIISASGYKTTILGGDSKEFPIIPRIKDAQTIQIPADILAGCLSSVVDSIALSESRPELAGIYINFSREGIIFAATDSFRLTEQIVKQKNAVTGAFILPRPAVNEVIKIASSSEDGVIISFNPNQASFNTHDFEFVSRLIDGTYPEYKKVIPDKVVSRVTVAKGELEKSTQIAGIFSSNISDIKIEAVKDKLKLSAKNPNKGDTQLTVGAELKNENFEISINYRYLLDGLKIMPSPKVDILFTGNNSPLIIRPHGVAEQITYLIMPLRG